MNVAVIACSLHPLSRSRVMAHHIAQDLDDLGVSVTPVDLRDLNLAFCGLPEARHNPKVAELKQLIETSAAILMAVPIYNFDVNAAAKNLIELTGRSWTNKLVGFLCAAGGRASYMSVMSIANSLMLDFRCLILPRFVYALGSDFENDRTEDMAVGEGEIRNRIRELAETTVSLARAIEPIFKE